MTIDLDELERLAAVASAGPWVCEYLPPLDPWTNDCFTVGPRGHDITVLDKLQEHDAAFIAAVSPDVVRDLIARVRESENLSQRREFEVLARERDIADMRDRLGELLDERDAALERGVRAGLEAAAKAAEEACWKEVATLETEEGRQGYFVCSTATRMAVLALDAATIAREVKP